MFRIAADITCRLEQLSHQAVHFKNLDLKRATFQFLWTVFRNTFRTLRHFSADHLKVKFFFQHIMQLVVGENSATIYVSLLYF